MECQGHSTPAQAQFKTYQGAHQFGLVKRFLCHVTHVPCAVNLSDSTLEGGDNRAEVATRTRAKLRLICVTYWAAMLQCDKFYCIPCKKQETGIFQNLLNLLCQNLIWIFLYYTHANVFYFSKISTSRVTHLFLHF